MSILWSVLLFVVAGLCEIGGGYLVWQWLREGKPIGYGMIRCTDPGALRGHSYLSNSGIRPSVCRLWRNFHCLVVTLGLGTRWGETGPL